LAGTASAQSAFEGFYGQLSTGYQSDQASSTGQTIVTNGTTTYNFNQSNQNFSGMPLILGLGYNWALDQSWMLGAGIDYDFLSSKSGTYSGTTTYSGGTTTFNGGQLKTSNRTNIYLTPGYALAKDKLVYLKAGYSTANLQQTFASSCTSTGTGNCSGSLSIPTQTNTVQGYILGLGYKQMVTSGLYGFAEVNYMSYGKSSFSVNDTVDNLRASSNPSLATYQALVGVGYKF